VSARGRLPPNEGGGCEGRITRVLEYAQRIARRREELRHRRLLGPREAGRSAGLPLQRGSGVPVVQFDERHKVGVVAIIILDQHAIVLQADDGDPVAGVLREGCDPETERGAWAHLLPWRRRLAPINRVDGPLIEADGYPRCGHLENRRYVHGASY
jgi:hypothetical protein